MVWASPFDAAECLQPLEVVGIVETPITSSDDSTTSTATGAPPCDAGSSP
jgi:hypothetical protein